MNTTEILETAFRATGLSQREVSIRTGQSRQALNQKLCNCSMRASEFMEIMDIIGIDVKFIDRATGLDILEGDANKRRKPVRGRIGEEKLTTYLAKLLKADEGYTGEQNGLALYENGNGRKFVVRYKDGKTRFFDVTNEELDYILKNGFDSTMSERYFR